MGKIVNICWLLITLVVPCLCFGQAVTPATRQLLDKLESYQLHNQSEQAVALLSRGIKATDNGSDLAYLYAYQATIYASMDSLLISQRLIDASFEAAAKTKAPAAMAAAYRASAFLSNLLNNQDAVVSAALKGLKLVEKDSSDPRTKYQLNYLLYSVYSKWNNSEKMSYYIGEAERFAQQAADPNLQVNVLNGLSSMFLASYNKTKEAALLDSSFYYLNRSLDLIEANPEKVSGNTYVIICINLANYYLEHSHEAAALREQKAFSYLDLAAKRLNKEEASPEKWGNLYGIKSGFAMQKGDLALAETYLLEGVKRLHQSSGHYYRLGYQLNKALADVATERKEYKTALQYQEEAEQLLSKQFNQQQLLNAQKLEVQYEAERKDQQLERATERESFRKRQNYLYGGIALVLLFGLVFMFISYHFKLRYSIERENKLAKQKEDSEKQAAMRLQLEQEEKARLQAEQELLALRRDQLEKEALANSLIIDRKNDTLKQIKDKIESGEAAHIHKLIKEEMLLQTDFEDIKLQVQQLHPDFFNRLNQKALQKLTPLDLKYCTYLYLKMTTKQIAQVLHIEQQSVRMFKYRLKQKFGLSKEEDLEAFLCELK